MRHAWSVPVLLVLAALAGYTLTTKPVRAQEEPFPVRVGDKVELALQDDGRWQCRIEEIKGVFARCSNPSERQGSTVGRPEPAEEWVNVTAVKWIKKAKDQR